MWNLIKYIKTLGKIKKIQKLRIASSSLVDFGDLETVGQIITSSISRLKIEELIEKNFTHDGTKYHRIKESIIEQ